MKERGILMNGAMVRATLAGVKTQTRRIIKPQPRGTPWFWEGDEVAPQPAWFDGYEYGHEPCGAATYDVNDPMICKFGVLGDRLFVRETWQFYDWTEDGEPCIRYAADNATAWPDYPEEYAEQVIGIWESLSGTENYAIDNRARDRKWRPSIHMFRWASRITLEITEVRVERLRAICEDDAVAEGAERAHWPSTIKGAAHGVASFRAGFARLWESRNGEGSWDLNPFCWVLEFRRIEETTGTGLTGLTINEERNVPVSR